MGIANIIETNIGKTTEKIWNILPQFPDINLNLNQYDQKLVNCMVLFGAITLIKSSIFIIKTAAKSIPNKIPTEKQMKSKYGDNSWAFIANCRYNEQYCEFLSSRGFNLILAGDQLDVKITQERILFLNNQHNTLIQRVIIDWNQNEKQLDIYNEILKRFSSYDISFLILPKIMIQNQQFSLQQSIPVFHHTYLFVRYLVPLLKWRSYCSAIIVPSCPNTIQVSEKNAITKGVMHGINSFGRILQVQLQGQLEVVVAQGSVQSAFAGLGKQRVTN